MSDLSATDVVTALALVGFLLGGSSGLIRLLRGPSLVDRVAALDVVLLTLMGGAVVEMARSGPSHTLDLVMVVAVVGFTASVATSRYLEQLSSEEGP